MAKHSHSLGLSTVYGEFPGIDFAYWWSIDAHRPRLDCAAIVRLPEPSVWAETDHHRQQPPESFGSVGGVALIGPYSLMFDESRAVLWVNNEWSVPLQGRNVVLLTDAAGTLQVVGTYLITEDLGGPPPAVVAEGTTDETGFQYGQWLAYMNVHVAELLRRSSATRSFVMPQTPT